MATSLLDLARPTPVGKSLSQQPTLNAAASAKPKTRFNDVLAQHRPAEPKTPKAEPHEQSAKADRTKKADATRKKGDDPQVDQGREADDDLEQAASTDEAAEAEASKPAEKPAKAKPTKETKKSDDAKANAGEQVDAEADASELDANQTATQPVSNLDLPTEDELAEAEKPIVIEKKSAADESPEQDPSAVDPATLAAQLAASTPQPVDAQAEQTDSVTDTDADSVTDVTAMATGKSQIQTQIAKPEQGAKIAAGEAVDGDAELAVQPHSEKKQADAGEDLLAAADEAAGAIALPHEFAKTDSKSTADVKIDPAALQAVAAPHDKGGPSHMSALPAVQQSEVPAQPRSVAEENVDRIVTSVRGEIATKGGTMQIRLDPPSLGAINVQISIDDGVMSASLQTNNDEATRLLSHNLAQLKSQLESAGVTVDRIQVKQAAPSEQSSNSNSQGDSGDRQQSRDAGQDQSARQEQQRREMLQRMWAKLAGNGDPLDLVA